MVTETAKLILQFEAEFKNMTSPQLKKYFKEMQRRTAAVGGKYGTEQDVVEYLAERKALKSEMDRRDAETAKRKNADEKKSTESSKKQSKATRNVLFLGLGLMFFFMGLAHTMQSLISPAAELSGIFEIIGLILTLLFLPVMLELLPLFLDLLKVVSDMDPGLKRLIGYAVLFFWLFSTLVSWFASLAIMVNAVVGAGLLGGGAGAAGGGVAAGGAAGLAVAFAQLAVVVVAAVAYWWIMIKALEAVTVAITDFIINLMPKEFLPAVKGYGEFTGGVISGVREGYTQATAGLGGVPVIGGILSGAAGMAGNAWLGPGENINKQIQITINNAMGLQTTWDVNQTSADVTGDTPVYR